MDKTTPPVTEQHPQTMYERPQIEDYGTLADLTAGFCSGRLDGYFGAPGGWQCGTPGS
jgi:hypothetical protein